MMPRVRFFLSLTVMLAATIPVAGQTVLYDFEFGDDGWGSYGTITTDSGLTFFGSSGLGRFHVGDFSLDDMFPDNPLLWGIVDVSPAGIDLSPFTGFSVDALFQSVPGFPRLHGRQDPGYRRRNGRR